MSYNITGNLDVSGDADIGQLYHGNSLSSSAGDFRHESGADSHFLFLDAGAEILHIGGTGTGDIAEFQASAVLLKQNVTIGAGAAGVDYTLTFNGETSDGVITFLEDESIFVFDSQVGVTTGTQAFGHKFKINEAAAETAVYMHISTDGHGTADTDGLIVGLNASGSAVIDAQDSALLIKYQGSTILDLDSASGIKIGAGAAGIDYSLTFVGENSTGIVTWKEDEDYFLFGDSVAVSDLTGSGTEVVTADANGVLGIVTNQVSIPMSFESYDAEPARGSESNIHGALLSLATGQPLNSVPTNIVVTKGIGKLMIVVNAGSDLAGDITVTGTSVNRDTGATSASDTDTITVDAVTTDGSDTDSNGNTRHSFTGAYISSKWFTGTVTLSTTNLTLTDVDVYHTSFEQFNDIGALTLNTFDVNLLTTNVNAEYDAYLYCLEVTGDKCDITRCASLNVGADGETAIANKYWRLRRAAIGQAFDTTTDGVWVDIHYSNSPAYVEDMTMKVWATRLQAVG